MEVITAQEAVRKYIKSGMTLAVEGFIGLMKPEELLIALRERFLETGEPRDLTVVHCAGQGDGTSPGCGINRLALEGLVGRIIASHFAMAPDIQRLILENKIAGYNLPQGVISHLYRDIAQSLPGNITHVGLDTFVDPSLEGGKLNEKARQAGDLVERIAIHGKPFLLYRAFPIDVVFLRATSCDAKGNCSLEREPVSLEVTAMAQAAQNSGGKVIVQVERLSDAPLDPHQVKIPACLVDAVVVAQPENHRMTNDFDFNPAFIQGGLASVKSQDAQTPLTIRQFIAQRAARELTPGAIVNLGIGMPEGISEAAAEMGISGMVLTTESGTIGGSPASGGSFGAAAYPDCILTQPEQFDFYDGGGLDIAFLGLAQADRFGNVNVSKFGSKLAGCGGFINITQNAKRVVFCGTFTSGGLQAEFHDCRLQILQEGRVKKFVRDVEQITFSARRAAETGQDVLFITERATFRLIDGVMTLTELTPGVDLERDVLAHMEFEIKVQETIN
ncbi:MAG: CoA-transferase [Thermoguttaceae bacterium]|nr:CoA-transferase [Thermoguttaceae bacterium]